MKDHVVDAGLENGVYKPIEHHRLSKGVKCEPVDLGGVGVTRWGCTLGGRRGIEVDQASFGDLESVETSLGTKGAITANDGGDDYNCLVFEEIDGNNEYVHCSEMNFSWAFEGR